MSIVGLKPGLIQQWQAAAGADQKRFACMVSTASFDWDLPPCSVLRFQYLKAFLLDRNLSSIHVSSYYEEFLDLDSLGRLRNLCC